LLLGRREALEPKPDRAVVDVEPPRLLELEPPEDRLDVDELERLLPPPPPLANASPQNPSTAAPAIAAAAAPANTRVKGGVPSDGGAGGVRSGALVGVVVGAFETVFVEVVEVIKSFCSSCEVWAQ
jgi:hypothetical protein